MVMALGQKAGIMGIMGVARGCIRRCIRIHKATLPPSLSTSLHTSIKPIKECPRNPSTTSIPTYLESTPPSTPLSPMWLIGIMLMSELAMSFRSTRNPKIDRLLEKRELRRRRKRTDLLLDICFHSILLQILLVLPTKILKTNSMKTLEMV